MRKDSPKCCKENFQALLAIITEKQWKVHALDAKSAFFRAKLLKGMFYIKPPREATTDIMEITNYSICFM